MLILTVMDDELFKIVALLKDPSHTRMFRMQEEVHMLSFIYITLGNHLQTCKSKCRQFFFNNKKYSTIVYLE